MKKVIMALGYIFLVCIVAIVAAAVALAIWGKKLDRESHAYIDSAVPVIAAEWNVEELKKRASPEFNDAVDYDILEEDFSSLQEQLGKLAEYKGSTGDSNITVSLSGYQITADYTAIAEYEEGSVEIRIALVRRGGQWKILDFTVSPEAAADRKDTI